MYLLSNDTGGLYDSVAPYNKFTSEGTGFTFTNFTVSDLFGALERADECYRDKKAYSKLVRRAMAEKFGWEASAQEYKKLYETLISLTV